MCPRTNIRGRGGHRGPFRGGRPSCRDGMGGTHPQRDYKAQYQDYMWILWLMAPQIRRRMQGLWAKNVTIVGDLDISQKYAGKDQTINVVKRPQ